MIITNIEKQVGKNKDLDFINKQIKLLKKSILNLQKGDKKDIKENQNILHKNIKILLMLMNYKIKFFHSSNNTDNELILNSILDL